MDRKEYDALLDLIDQMIVTSEPRRGEYFRGYLRGIQFHVLGTLEISVQEHSQLCDATDETRGEGIPEKEEEATARRMTARILC